MTVKVRGVVYDAMGEACKRLNISRQTMLRYFDIGYFTKPNTVRQGRSKDTRYFDNDWYAINETKLIADRNAGRLPAEDVQINELAEENEPPEADRTPPKDEDSQNQVVRLTTDNDAPTSD